MAARPAPPAVGAHRGRQPRRHHRHDHRAPGPAGGRVDPGRAAADRHRPAGRGGPRAGHPAAGAAARRALLGAVGVGDRDVRHAAARARLHRHRDPGGRARHGVHHEPLPPHRGARRRPGDRDRHAGRGPDRPEGPRGLPRHRRRGSRRASAASRRAPARSPRSPWSPSPPARPQPRPESDRPVAVQLDGVSAGYGGIDVLQDISLTVRAGEVCAVLGPNGAGKSTALKVMSGQLAPTKGTASHQRPVDRRRPDRAPGPRRAVRGPGGTGDLPEPHRHREPQDGQLRRDQLRGHPGEVLPAVPAARRAPQPAGGQALRRRAADAVDGPRPGREPVRPAGRRAVDGPRAQDRRGTVRGARGHRPAGPDDPGGGAVRGRGAQGGRLRRAAHQRADHLPRRPRRRGRHDQLGLPRRRARRARGGRPAAGTARGSERTAGHDPPARARHRRARPRSAGKPRRCMANPPAAAGRVPGPGRPGGVAGDDRRP